MNLYLATTTIDDSLLNCYKKLLCSYHYFKSDKKIKLLNDTTLDSLFIDSGAFSAFNSGAVINLDDYCKYLLKVKPQIYAGLDDLASPDKSISNIEYMEKEYNLTPLPTFHMKEPIDFLIPMIEKYDYIALGGMVYSENIENWALGVWKEIYKRKPKLKVHGFGLTNQKYIEQYPWYSLDSTSFDRADRYGLVTYFNKAKGELYTEHVSLFNHNYIKAGGSETIETDAKLRRKETLKQSISAFVDYINYVTEMHETKSFDYLLHQLELF